MTTSPFDQIPAILFTLTTQQLEIIILYLTQIYASFVALASMHLSGPQVQRRCDMDWSV